MTASLPLVKIENLCIDLPSWAERHQAVIDASLTINQGEMVCVVGESGSGKSLLARSTIDLLPKPHVRVTQGAVILRGENLLNISAARMRAIRGKDIGFIFQEPMTALNPVLSIGRQIDEVLAVHTDLSTEARRERVLSALKGVSLPDPDRIVEAFPHQLSGGQRQRAMIAMATVLEPSLVIADEPTTALDVTTQAQILKLIKDLQSRRGAGVMFITHDLGVVADIADKVAVMEKGHIVESGSVDQILNRPNHPYTKALLAAVPSLYPPARAKSLEGPILLHASGLTKSFGSRGTLFRRSQVHYAVKSADILLRQGETLGLVGESGSGKSTLARCIVRLIDPDSGSVVVKGVDLLKLSRRQMRRHRRRIQFVFQDPVTSLNPRQTVGEIIAKGPIANAWSPKDAFAKAKELLELVGLDKSAFRRHPHEFSGGQRQRIGIARALALEPDILVADEPVSALDVSVQSQILELLADIKSRLGLTMLFITHDLRVAAQVCDRVAVMKEGQIVESGPTDEVYLRPREEYTQKLLASIPGRAWSGSIRGVDVLDSGSLVSGV